MFKGSKSANNKNITYPNTLLPLFIFTDRQKEGLKTLKIKHAYQLYPTHSLENKTCPWIRAL